MPEKHENIEDFVQKVVDQSEAQIPFNESHWQQMEAMLDAQMPIASDPGVGYYYFSNVVSLLVGLVFVWSWYVGGSFQENQLAIQDDRVEVRAPQKESATTSTGVTTDQASQAIKTPAQPETAFESASTDDPSQITGQGQSEPAAATNRESKKEEVQRTKILSEADAATTMDLPKSTSSLREKEDEPLVDAHRSVGKAASPHSATDKEEMTDKRQGLSQASAVGPILQTSVTNAQPASMLLSNDDEAVFEEFDFLSGIGIDLEEDLPDFPDQLVKVTIVAADGGSYESTNTPIVRRALRSSYSRLSVGISLAPDLSSNQIFRYNRLGSDLGIVLDYWVAPRLAIAVGAFNTSKRYLVGGEQYSPPSGFWGNVTNGERPDKIDADCQVLDIPINLKYRLVTGPRLNIYASAGVSSYIMLREEYQYELENGWKSTWGTSNANQHFFGVGNLQVHFERRFGEHLAVEVAPFFKAPLTSYGHGNIRFHSMGSFFTVRKYFLNR